MTRKLVQVRLPSDLVKQVDHMAVEWSVKRGPAIERLLWEAILAPMDIEQPGPPDPNPDVAGRTQR